MIRLSFNRRTRRDASPGRRGEGRGRPAPRYIVCRGWTRSHDAFRAAAEDGKLRRVEIRDVSEPGAKGAAQLAREALN